MKQNNPGFSVYRLMFAIGEGGKYILFLLLVFYIMRGGEAMIGGELVMFPCIIAWKYMRFPQSKYYKYFKTKKRECERTLLKKTHTNTEKQNGKRIEVDCSSLYSLINDTLTKTGARNDF